jgi:hypothetical protein
MYTGVACVERNNNLRMNAADLSSSETCHSGRIGDPVCFRRHAFVLDPSLSPLVLS